MTDELRDEVPDADALEQRRSVDADDDADDASVVPDDESLETPEADRLEQSQDAGVPDDDR